MADETEGLLAQRIDKAKELLLICDTLSSTIEGLQKLKRKILAELKFLESLKTRNEVLKDTHIKSTNLSFLEAVVLEAASEKDVTAVFKPFCFSRAGSEESCSVVVDVVASNGCCWIKITARNALALHRTWQGQGDFGDRDIVQQTEELQEASKQHPVNYVPPLVVLSSFNGITESLAKALTRIGLRIKGKILPDPGKQTLTQVNTATSEVEINTASHLQSFQECQRVNLDITAMIAYVSALTNGGSGFVFKEAVLTEQAQQERQNPVLPKLKTFLQGKKLFACQAAVRDFNAILRTVGGDKERQRAEGLLEKVTVVDDNPSIRSTALQPSASVKERSKIIFGTGDSLKATTATANVAFMRAAASQGVEFSVFIHESRALTESKEPQASPVETVHDIT